MVSFEFDHSEIKKKIILSFANGEVKGFLKTIKRRITITTKRSKRTNSGCSFVVCKLNYLKKVTVPGECFLHKIFVPCK